ncbi:MAG: hypothetical protein M1814_004431 [Vezdaea aestivalis]|nr:MAG: hypothetical protein M1814_004431 [Vezdaea aestivalis]
MSEMRPAIPAAIGEAIATTGPISIAAYMRQCLTSPSGGYYTSTQAVGSDQFGPRGDFVTSPEISQMFGELVGIWLMSEWAKQNRGRRKNVVLIELGPGRATLMSDILRTLRQLKAMNGCIETIYLVEASPALREAQRALLCGDEPFEEIDIGHRSRISDLNVKIVWCEDFRFVPKGPRIFLCLLPVTIILTLPSDCPDPDQMPFIIAHEFFDALPIHAFQAAQTSPPPSKPQTPNTLRQWRELLVTPTAPPSILNPPSPSAPPTPDFQLVLSKHQTGHAQYLPHQSSRYKPLLNISDATIEISPESLSAMWSIAEHIGGVSPLKRPPGAGKGPSKVPDSPLPKSQPSGAALIIDYGSAETVPVNSLRGIRAHRHTSPFERAGETDLSADVDFGALVETALKASKGVEAHGPVEQGAWLENMGIRELAKILKGKGAKGVDEALDRLVGRERAGMGKVYKVLSVVPERNGVPPVGFGGDV